MARRMNHSQRGFSFIELLIVLSLAGIIISAIYDFSISQQKAFVVQEQITDMQQSGRSGMDFLLKDLIKAGLDYSVVIGNDTLTTDIGLDPLTVLDGGSNPDTIIIRYSDYVAEWYHYEPPTDQEVHIMGGSGQHFTIGGKVLIQNDAGDSNVLSVTNIQLGTHGGASDHIFFNPYSIGGSGYGKPDYPAVMKTIREIEYLVDNSDPYRPVLRRYTDGKAMLIAENVEDLQFVTRDADGNPTSLADDIRSVDVTLEVRTNLKDQSGFGGDGYQRKTLTSSVSPRNLVN